MDITLSDLPKNQICIYVRFVDFYWDLKTLTEDKGWLSILKPIKNIIVPSVGTNPHV